MRKSFSIPRKVIPFIVAILLGAVTSLIIVFFKLENNLAFILIILTAAALLLWGLWYAFVLPEKDEDI